MQSPIPKSLLQYGLPSFLLLLPGLIGNWPQWRGPLFNGSTPAARNLAVTWNQTDNVQWRSKLPSWSAATPIVWDDTVLITTAEEGSSRLNTGRSQGGAADNLPNRIFLLAINRKDGTTRWQRQIDDGNRLFRKQNSASPSPVTDGKHVWVITGNGKLSCFTMGGELVWNRDIQAEYGRFGLNHGYASTPLLYGERLYIQVVHGFRTQDPSYVFAVDKKTGRTAWKVYRTTDAIKESKDNYSTPQIAIVGGKPQLVVSGADWVTGQEIDTGKEIWRIGGFNPMNFSANRTIASALVIGDIILASGSRGRPVIAFHTGGTGNITGKSEVWTNNLGADVPTPATDGRLIYFLQDNGILSCVEASSGKPIYQGKRVQPATYSASPLLADDKLYCLSEEGTTTVVKAGPEFEILSVNPLNEFTLASPVAVDDEIFIRTFDHLYCIRKPLR